MLGIRCQGEDESCSLCLNPRCDCKSHKRDKTRQARIKAQKNLRRTPRKPRKGVYWMDNPEEGESVEFRGQ